MLTLKDIEKGKVKICDEETVFDCYFPKQRRYWNGWACPIGLTKESVYKFLSFYFTLKESSYELGSVLETIETLEKITIEGLEVYAIGDGLIWEEIEL
tara:strand:- start:266 stop:559 length:294 start_codon:yes stop_codon:yes gene_type:complete